MAMKRKQKRYAAAPEPHMRGLVARELSKVAADKLREAKRSLSGGDCVDALDEGVRARSAARAALEHAMTGKPEEAKAISLIRDADDFLFERFVPACVRQGRK